MDIVFNINPLGLEGFGPTLSSLLRNCSDSKSISFWVLCSELKKSDKENIKKLLELECFEGKTEFIDVNAKKIFGHYRSLHGDWTTYARLLIPIYVESDFALYLDSDLIIQVDVLDLFKFKFNQEILAAVYGCNVSFALDHSFLINKLNWPENQGYFNAGVLFLNLKKWRSSNVEEKWKQIAEQYPNDLLSHDQTLLNAICEGNFGELPACYNVEWYPGMEEPSIKENSIIHFVGSPKPWDILGPFIHNGFDVWKSYNVDFWKRNYGNLNLDKIKRTWKIKNSLVKNLKYKFTRILN